MEKKSLESRGKEQNRKWLLKFRKLKYKQCKFQRDILRKKLSKIARPEIVPSQEDMSI